jgi:hypothetical protein
MTGHITSKRDNNVYVIQSPSTWGDVLPATEGSKSVIKQWCMLLPGLVSCISLVGGSKHEGDKVGIIAKSSRYVIFDQETHQQSGRWILHHVVVGRSGVV